jgi:uncharacterized Zn finger protein (UPF0148 family)
MLSKEQMTAAAELLRKGGTLVTEACNACGGVQVKYSGKIVCINCGKQEEIKVEAREVKMETKPQTDVMVIELKNTVLTKINELLPTLKFESDVGKQSELVKLLICYLEVLQKMPKDNESRQ